MSTSPPSSSGQRALPRGTLVVRGGRVVCGATGLDATGDVVVLDGVIASLPGGRGAATVAAANDAARARVPADAPIIDATGAWVLPGMIDLGVHLRDPGREHDEDLATTIASALRGGVTTLLALPDTSPAVDGADDVLHRHAAWSIELSKRAGLAPTMIVAGALTRRREGKEPSDAADMAAAGVRVFSDAAFIDDNEVLRRALEYARGAGGALALLAGPDAGLSRGGVVVEGEIATRLGLPGIPELADALAAFRHIELAALAGIDVHLGPLFTAAALDVLVAARARATAATATAAGVRGGAAASGPAISAEVHPWHLLLDERGHLERRYDTLLRLDPPLPTAASRARLLEAVRAGELAVSSGHRPVANRTKDLEMAIAEAGASALALTLPLLCGLLTPVELARATSALPARILGLTDRGRLEAGARADLVVLRPAGEGARAIEQGDVVDAALAGTKAPANPWLGRRTSGRVEATIVAGAVAYERVAGGAR